ncbi:MAG: WbqC family protein [Sediminibacterium sp.]
MVYTDLHYFGALSYYHVFAQHGHIIFDCTTAFSKMSFKNRMVIATAQGPMHLSIPIVGGRDQKTPMNEIRIAYDSPWKSQHFKAISFNYKRAPYFEYFVDSLKSLYDNDFEHLIDFLLATQHWTKQQLKAKWLIETSIEQPTISLETKWMDSSKPNNFQTEGNSFQYQQVFDESTGFIQNACILDALFAMGGKQALTMISTF